jgi:hypothetical protein
MTEFYFFLRNWRQNLKTDWQYLNTGAVFCVVFPHGAGPALEAGGRHGFFKYEGIDTN